MKKIIVMVLSVLIFITCKGRINKEPDNRNVFCPALEREILNTIEENRGNEKFTVCNVIISNDMNRNKICIVTISLGTCIVRKMIKFIPPESEQNIQNNSEFIGYTFLENNLIACCLLSDSCSNELINKNELYPIQDSIPGYPDILTDYSEFAPTKRYEIVNGNSLKLMVSNFLRK